MSYPVESQNAAMPPRRSVAAINASVEAPKEVADACETTIRDEFQHVAIRPNGVEMDGKHMDNGKSIPLDYVPKLHSSHAEFASGKEL